MSDLLTNLASKALGRANSVSPRLRSRFEPPAVAPLSGLTGADSPAVEDDRMTGADNLPTAPPAAMPEQSRAVTSPPPLTQRSVSARVQGASRDQAMTRDQAAQPLEQVWRGPQPQPSAKSDVPVAGEAAPPAPPSAASHSGLEEGESARKVTPDPQVRPTDYTTVPAPVVVTPQIAPRDAPLPSVEPVVRTDAPGPVPHAEPSPEPTINVTIGRIEVRAVPQEQPKPPRRARAPVLSLEEYLRQRAEGRR